MNIHKNARLTPYLRVRIVERVLAKQQTPRDAAAACGVSLRTIHKWLARYRSEGVAGLHDRSSRPHRSPRRTSRALVERVISLRRQRWTGRHIAQAVGLSPATISRILRRAGLNRIRDLEPARPLRRYEHAAPGDLLHLDISSAASSAPVIRYRRSLSGQSRRWWEFVHVAIDDNSRLAFSQILPDERSHSAVAFLDAAVGYYRSLGVPIRRLLTDNGSCYRSRLFRDACRRLGIRHRFTRPYTPRTNGKAERFIQTALREWAYARSYSSSQQRAAHLLPWLHHYNWHRPHASLHYLPPFSRLLIPEQPLEAPPSRRGPAAVLREVLAEFK